MTSKAHCCRLRTAAIIARRRRLLLEPETGILASIKNFYLNTINAIKSKLPWWDKT